MDYKQAIDIMLEAPTLRNHGGKPQIVTVGDFIYSYDTCVAVYVSGKVYVPKWHSTTTSRHINKIADNWHAEVVILY